MNGETFPQWLFLISVKALCTNQNIADLSVLSRSFSDVYFQVILTGYEITVSSDLMIWSTWALILKEISHLLLIAYSAFNPLAYCGELIWKHLVLRFWNALLCKRNSLPNLNTEGNVTRLRNSGWGPIISQAGDPTLWLGKGAGNLQILQFLEFLHCKTPKILYLLIFNDLHHLNCNKVLFLKFSYCKNAQILHFGRQN